jgi:hypothetical protein
MNAEMGGLGPPIHFLTHKSRLRHSFPIILAHGDQALPWKAVRDLHDAETAGHGFA